MKNDLSEYSSSLSFAIELTVGQGVNVLDRSIQIMGDVDETMLKRIDMGLAVLEKFDNSPIYIRICTAGGHLYQAFAIAGRLQRSPCKIITEAFGQCMSSGVLIFAAGDVRIARDPILFMLHQVSAELPEEKLLALKAMVIQMRSEQDLYIQYLAAKTGTPEKIWKNYVNQPSDSYLTASQALDLNLATEMHK